MPWLFVVIWSTGFVVARLAMPHAPPFGFLSYRFALSALCLTAWVAIARAAWPASRAQWGHLLVTGVLMQAWAVSTDKRFGKSWNWALDCALSRRRFRR